jgi:hypothetical protein
MIALRFPGGFDEVSRRRKKIKRQVIKYEYTIVIFEGTEK